MLRQEVDEAAQDRLGVTHQGHGGRLEARRLLGIGIDADHREVVVQAPLVERVVQVGADGEHHVGLGPFLVPERERHAQGIAGIEHAAAAPEGQHRGLQQARELRDLGGRVLGAAAGDDQRADRAA